MGVDSVHSKALELYSSLYGMDTFLLTALVDQASNLGDFDQVNVLLKEAQAKFVPINERVLHNLFYNLALKDESYRIRTLLDRMLGKYGVRINTGLFRQLLRGVLLAENDLLMNRDTLSMTCKIGLNFVSPVDLEETINFIETCPATNKARHQYVLSFISDLVVSEYAHFDGRSFGLKASLISTCLSKFHPPADVIFSGLANIEGEDGMQFEQGVVLYVVKHCNQMEVDRLAEAMLKYLYPARFSPKLLKAVHGSLQLESGLRSRFNKRFEDKLIEVARAKLD